MHVLIKVLRVLWTPQYRAAFLRWRVAASTEHDDILSGLGLQTIVDVGANRGQFALCARRLYPQAAIFSFEPLQKPADRYQKVFGNDVRARLIRKAIAARPGIAVPMHVARWDVSSSLLPIGQAQRANFPFTQESRQEAVSVTRLSSCFDEGLQISGTALLKLDVQGSELDTLQGCDDLLELFHYVYVEASFVELYVGQALAGEVVAYLIARGYSLICVANLSCGRSGRPIQADFLFSRSAPPR